MSIHEHVESLRTKHAHLEQMIDEELRRPLPDQGTVSRLKKEKLRIKEAIERLRHEEAAHATAVGAASS
jgi:hypothetical protein